MGRLFGRTNKGRVGGLIPSICLHRIWPQMGGRSPCLTWSHSRSAVSDVST